MFCDWGRKISKQYPRTFERGESNPASYLPFLREEAFTPHPMYWASYEPAQPGEELSMNERAGKKQLKNLQISN
jgi:hypothetical protein